MPKQGEVGLVEGESNINRRRTSQPRRHPRRMTKHIAPRSRVFQTNLLILGTAHGEARQLRPTLRNKRPATNAGSFMQSQSGMGGTLWRPMRTQVSQVPRVATKGPVSTN
jgi:hypothetical protein